MAILKTKVKKYLEANSKTFEAEGHNISLQNNSDGNGDYISVWNVSGLAKPTDEQLTSYEDVGNTEEALNVILSNRRNAYPPLKDFAEAYTEKEILADTTKWDDYVIKYNKVRTDNPK